MKPLIKTLCVILSLLLTVQVLPLNASAIEALNSSFDTAAPETGEAQASELTEEPYIVSEELSRREENVKHFKMSDGTYQAAVYAEPVHYSENGQWKEYDNSIKTNTAAKSGADKYTAGSAGNNITFPDKITGGNEIKINNGEYEISFGYKKKSYDLSTPCPQSWGNRCFLIYANCSLLRAISYILKMKDFPFSRLLP